MHVPLISILMSDEGSPLSPLERKLRFALELGDLAMLEELLDPNVVWGPPDDPSPPCQNREQVLSWYRKGRAAGAHAEVQEVARVGSRLLVGLVVTGTNSAKERGGRVSRWQVFGVKDGRITSIVGFERKSDALTWIAAQPSTHD